jgi:hypothetical protein
MTGEYVYDILKLGDVLKGLGVAEKGTERDSRKDAKSP